MNYENLQCPYCGGTHFYLTSESFNYKAAFWAGIFLNIIGILLFGFLCRKRTICHCKECGNEFSFYE